MNRRTFLVVAGWAGAAVLAVLAGIAGISVLGSGLTSAGTSPRSEAQVARELAAQPSPSAPGASTTASARPPQSPSSARPAQTPAASGAPTAVSRTLKTAGGTVVARCVAGVPEIDTMSPAQGYALHEREGAEGEFRAISDNHNRVRFTVACSSGRPSLTTRDDD